MQASVLLVDGIATNRVALKVKLSVAWYHVTMAATGQEALAAILRDRPDLVVLSDTLPDFALTDLCATITATCGADAPPMLVLGHAMQSRTALLRAGVDDMLTAPIDKKLLIARVRSMLRSHATEAEWRMRDVTNRALGFAEAATEFTGPVPVTVLHDPDQRLPDTLLGLERHRGVRVHRSTLEDGLTSLGGAAPGTVVVIAPPLSGDPDPALGLVTDLRAHAQTRNLAVLVVVPNNRPDIACRALDLGADEIVPAGSGNAEVTLRLRRLHARVKNAERLRQSIRDGAAAAIRDPLTGLYNRRYAMPYLERICEQSRLSGKSFAVMIADLDHFKQINDWHGHPAGDAVLTGCAQRFVKTMRPVDLVARFGGEEFLMVMPGVDMAEAREMALNLCRTVGQSPFQIPGSDTETVPVTVSIGLALANSTDGVEGAGLPLDFQPQDILARADKALYRAKELGRNQISESGREAA